MSNQVYLDDELRMIVARLEQGPVSQSELQVMVKTIASSLLVVFDDVDELKEECGVEEEDEDDDDDEDET